LPPTLQPVLHELPLQVYAPHPCAAAPLQPPFTHDVPGVRMPPEHDCPGQTWPQVPQLLPSLPFTVTQVVPPQQSWPALHWTPHAPQFAVVLVAAHAPPQQDVPEEHTLPQLPQLFGSPPFVFTHVPPQQLCPVAHTVPQPPQLATSVPCVFTQVPLQHASVPGGQGFPQPPQLLMSSPLVGVHALWQQPCPLGQAIPQALQLASSLVVSVQIVPQQVRPEPHATLQPPQFDGSPVVLWHTPSQQDSPAWHAAPHAPQLALSSALMHALSQQISPAAQAGAAQPPQWAGLVAVFWQRSAQQVSPVGHAGQPWQAVELGSKGEQLPPQHASLEVHLRPQAPQLSRSFVGSVQTPPQHFMSLQVWPHVPQFVVSLTVSWHAPSQQVSPG
jgi:hypothetical protein